MSQKFIDIYEGNKEIEKAESKLLEAANKQGIKITRELVNESIKFIFNKGEKNLACHIMKYTATEIWVSFKGENISTLAKPAVELSEVIGKEGKDLTAVIIKALPTMNDGELPAKRIVKTNEYYQYFLDGNGPAPLRQEEKEPDLFYINIKNNYMENLDACVKVIKKMIEELKEKDVTVTERGQLISTTYMQEYYYKGVENSLALEFDAETTFSDKVLQMRVNIKDSKHLAAVLRDSFEQIEAASKFTILLDPPKKHFKKALTLAFRNQYDLLDEVFNLLSHTLSPEEIEAKFALNTAGLYKSINISQKHTLLRIDKFYYILDFTNKNSVTEFTEGAKAISKYKQTVNELLYNEYVEMKKNFNEELASDLEEEGSLITI